MKEDKRVTWAIRWRDNHPDNYEEWYNGYGKDKDAWSPVKEHRVEFGFRDAAIEKYFNIKDVNTVGKTSLVKITRTKKVNKTKDELLKFEPGDIWEWIDQEEAEDNCQRVGWCVRVDSVCNNPQYVNVEFVGGCDEWHINLTSGLKLIERNGEPVA